MSRKRYITSEISINRKVASLASADPEAALLWPWIIKELDDWARMKADPIELKLNVLQAFSYTPAWIQERLEHMADIGLVVLYQADGRQHLIVDPTTYYELQTNIAKERREFDCSRLPPPFDHPWAAFWPKSVWDSDSSRRTKHQHETARTSKQPQQPAIDRNELQQPAGNVLSTFPPSLPSPSTFPPSHPSRAEEATAAMEEGVGGGARAGGLAGAILLHPVTAEPLDIHDWRHAYQQIFARTTLPRADDGQFQRWCEAGLEPAVIVRELLRAVELKIRLPTSWAVSTITPLFGAGIRTLAAADEYLRQREIEQNKESSTWSAGRRGRRQSTHSQMGTSAPNQPGQQQGEPLVNKWVPTKRKPNEGTEQERGP